MDSADSPLERMKLAARQAESGGDIASAVAAWQRYRDQEPDDPHGFLEEGKLLKRLGRRADAAELLDRGRERFPDNEWIAIEHAWLIQETGDYPMSLACWRVVHEKFPGNLSGYIGVGLALRRLGNFEAADDVYREALERFPPHEALYMEFAWSAEESRNSGESIRRWAKVRAHFPNLVLGYVRGGILLRDSRRYLEADATLRTAIDRFPDNAEAAIAYAWTAHVQRDWTEALKRWESVALKFPDFVDGRCAAAEVLMEMARFAEAANVLLPASRMFPENERVAVLAGRVATKRTDIHESLATWKDIHGRFPNNAEACRSHAGALADVGEVELAESLLLGCKQQHPDDPNVAMDFALLPVRRQEWPLAIERWRQAVERFPHVRNVWLGLCNSLLKMGLTSEAEANFKAAREQFPGDIELETAEAQGFEGLKDWSQAISLWTSITRHHPGNPTGFLGLSRALRESGQITRAIGVLIDALQRFPQNLDLEIQLALAQGSTADWQQAVERWEQLRRRFPQGQLLATQAYKMMEAARVNQPELFAVPSGDALDPVDAAGDGKSLAALLKRFESLGDDCEFGLVQRIFHADALNLLRWARTLPSAFLKAVETNFDGVGDPEHTIIRIQGHEYMTEDRRFSMVSHTFTPPSMTPFDVFAVEQCRRMQWLRRKLLNDLANSKKIFVYKTESVPDDEMLAIYNALRRYSANLRLLFVQLQDDTHPAGSLERATGNLFVGRMDKFSTIDISISIWIQLCREVVAQLDTSAADASAALSS
jgi:tetratricopeptide (TPR) repeat protein